MKSLALLSLFFVTSLHAAPPDKPVTLLLPDPVLKAESAFELRFAEPMVGEEMVGKVTESPLLILTFTSVVLPGTTGEWKWLSTQSGVLTPSAPLPLGQVFTFSLRDHLKNAAGQPVHYTLKETARTPPFMVKGWFSPQYFSSDDAPGELVISLLFNAPVDAAATAGHLWFVNAENAKVAVKVEQAVPKLGYEHNFPSHRSDDKSSLTWDQQFAEHRKSDAEKAAEEEAEEEDDEVDQKEKAEKAPPQPSPNHIRVKPATTLTPGTGWKLVAEAGLPSIAGDKLSAPYEVEIGTVKPFGVEKIRADSTVNSGRRITIQLSKNLSKKLKPEDAANWFTVEPAPANFRIELPEALGDRNVVVLHGDFELAKDYTVKVKAGLPASEPFAMAAEFTGTVTFVPIAARLYFQDFSVHQQRAGTRQFRLLNINVPTFRVTAKLIRPDAVAGALLAYRQYYKKDGVEADEWLQKVDDSTLPGQILWEKDFINDQPVDVKKHLTLSWDEILGAGKTGAVLLTVEQSEAVAPNVKRAGAQALVQVTDLGVAWKYSADAFLHIFSLNTGQPVGGARVAMLAEDGKLLGQAKTVADGTATLPKLDNVEWLLVTAGADEHLVPFGGERDEQEFGRFRISQDGGEENIYDFGGEFGGTWRGKIFSDRPVYKPGETVHLKAVVRDHAPGHPVLPKNFPATWVIAGPNERRILEQKVKLSATGTTQVDVTLPPGIVGDYAARLVFDGGGEAGSDAGIDHSWMVEEYVPNAFEVKLSTPKNAQPGTRVEVPVVAKYFMGKALSRAQLNWSISANDAPFTPEGFDAFDFCNCVHSHQLSSKLTGTRSFSQQGKAALAEDGRAVIGAGIPINTKLPQPRAVEALAEVTDLDQQTIAERAEFTIHSSDFYLGLKRGPEVVREGETLPLELIAVKTDGMPVQDPVEATVKLTRIEWQTNRVEDADDADNFRSEPLMQLLGQTPVTTQAVTKGNEGWQTAQPEKKNTSFKVEKPGLYLVTAVAQDAAGHDVITSTTVYVYGKNETVWNYRNRFQVDLVPDKPSYSPGEAATLLVKTPISGSALVTVEREHVLRHFVVKLEGNAPTVRIPIEEGDAPNIYVSVMIFRGAQDSSKKFKAPEYRAGYTGIKVTRPDAKLYVQARPDRPDYRPGDEVTLTCEVRDFEGHPVREAEVTLWAADEGVLSLRGFETPDLLHFFSAPMRLEVTTGLTLPHLFDENPENATFENKGYLVGGYSKCAAADIDVRRNFLGTAFWAPSLKTDAAGNLTAHFKAPDGLTRYRVMAVAQTPRDQFGHTESAFEINKPFMLEPAPPRFANAGDQMVVRAVLHNTTAQAGEAEVRLDLDSLASTTGPAQKIKLAAGASLALDFPVEFKEPGETKWTWTGTFKTEDGKTSFRDAVETQLHVAYPTPLLREILQARVDTVTKDLISPADPALLEGTGVVRVTVSNSRIFEIREGVSELLHYPYGCVEQTTSAMIPWLVLRDFREVLPELKKSDTEFSTAVDKSITRLFIMQTSSGGLSYWPEGDVADFWGSAYATLGLALAQRAGSFVPDADFERLCAYLSVQLRGVTADGTPVVAPKVVDYPPRALACYALALAGKAEPAYHELLFQKRAELSQESRALVALAILESKGPAKMAETLLRMTDKPLAEEGWFGNLARMQGVRLLAWSRLSPKSKMADETANAVFALRTKGHWGTTQGNVWSVLGLTEYIRKTEAGRKEIKGSLTYGNARPTFQLPAKGAFFEQEFPLNGKAPLLVGQPSGGTLFTQVKIETRPKTLVTQRTDRGYTINRRYQRINDDGTVADLGEPRVGDRVLVTLDLIVPKESGYLAIEDPLPAVFEAVNAAFKSQDMQGAQLAVQPWMSFAEQHEDRSMFFADLITPGKHSIRYLARVRAAGAATAPPAKVEEMYHPDRFGLSDSIIVTAKALE